MNAYHLTSISSSSERETFTIWMKSLVFHGNGCTVRNSRGNFFFESIITKDNVTIIMDSPGRVLFFINKKKNYEFWDVGKDISGLILKLARKNNGFNFQVRRNNKIFSREMTCCVTLKNDQTTQSCYRIMRFPRKSTFKIFDCQGQIMVMQKLSAAVLVGNLLIHAQRNLK
ncbi:protein LURP-one-related 2-like [Olea europaea var. sylvestris]|uniref:protein LURP-one-related 2-like n=1 Tax=Olea europaea var. sylvestris TaxID=158386 RepID=UPI000C1D4441|nr:protein LURP-one-related 2-like [Olea europaea var. sylvestris]